MRLSSGQIVYHIYPRLPHQGFFVNKVVYLMPIDDYGGVDVAMKDLVISWDPRKEKSTPYKVGETTTVDKGDLVSTLKEVRRELIRRTFLSGKIL